MLIYLKNIAIFLLTKEMPNLQDLENLINKVKDKVLKKTGINLELEVKIIGEKCEKFDCCTPMGGLSGERKISFLTGKACSQSIKKKGI